MNEQEKQTPREPETVIVSLKNGERIIVPNAVNITFDDYNRNSLFCVELVKERLVFFNGNQVRFVAFEKDIVT